MAKNKYKLNPQTLTYEVIAIPFRIKFYRFLRKLLIGFILASIVNLLFSFFVYTPKMYRITEENNDLIIKYDILQNRVRAATAKINEIKHRDNNVYRPLFGSDTIDIQGIYSPYADSKYAPLQNDTYTPLMMATWTDMDAMTRLLYRTSVSFDQLELFAKDKEKMAESIPAIWPVDKRKFSGKIDPFGIRWHPILGGMRMHDGIDLGGRKGDPVYATGNGIVGLNNPDLMGYGNQILLEHGFGYMTRYAHLSKILVKPGQQVKRGELIGEVGSTGRSNGPHLHYEVIYMGRVVDPLNYFSRDMSEEEFARIIESAEATTFEAL